MIKETQASDLLCANKRIFSTLTLYESFVGFAKGQLYRMEHQAFQSYMGNNRKKLVEKYGYDTKNALHLIRLMRMCVEFLDSGELIVERPDASELLEIKHGKYSLDEIKQMAEELFVKAEDAKRKSRLPEKTDSVFANSVCEKIVRKAQALRSKNDNIY